MDPLEPSRRCLCREEVRVPLLFDRNSLPARSFFRSSRCSVAVAAAAAAVVVVAVVVAVVVVDLKLPPLLLPLRPLANLPPSPLVLPAR